MRLIYCTGTPISCLGVREPPVQNSYRRTLLKSPVGQFLGRPEPKPQKTARTFCNTQPTPLPALRRPPRSPSAPWCAPPLQSPRQPGPLPFARRLRRRAPPNHRPRLNPAAALFLCAVEPGTASKGRRAPVPGWRSHGRLCRAAAGCPGVGRFRPHGWGWRQQQFPAAGDGRLGGASDWPDGRAGAQLEFHRLRGDAAHLVSFCTRAQHRAGEAYTQTSTHAQGGAREQLRAPHAAKNQLATNCKLGDWREGQEARLS